MKHTKHKLLSSIATLFVCLAMFIGSTYAWFTDSASTGVNKIQAGNLDIDVSYKNGNDWTSIQDATTLFSTNLWEPGHTEYVTLKVTNKGTLALKYKVMVTPVSENGGINVYDENFKLSDYLVFGTVKSDTEPNYTRDTVRTEVGTTQGIEDVNTLTEEYSMVKDAAPQYITLVVYMPEGVDNHANAKPGTTAPSIDLGIKVVATQFENEKDSFGDDYDAGAVNGPDYIAGPFYDYFQQVNISKTIDATTFTLSSNGNETTVSPTNTVMVSGETTAGSTVNVTVNKTSKPEEVTVAENRSAIAYNVKVTGQTEGSIVTVHLYVGTGLNNIEFFHTKSTTTVKMTKTDAFAGDATDVDKFTYDKNTGILTFKANEFSPFTGVYDDAVASITNENGTAVYGTVEAAFAAVKNGETITVLKDSAGNGVKVPSESNFTVDFNNHSYNIDATTVGSAHTETNGFQLLKGSTITFKNGKLTSSKAKILIQNYSNLTLENMYLDGTKLSGSDPYVLSNNYGNVNIIGNTSIIAKESGYAFDAYYWPNGGYGEGVSVTVNTTGTIRGTIEYGSDGTGTSKDDISTRALINLNNGKFENASISVYSCNGIPNIKKSSTVSIKAPDTYCWNKNGTLSKAAAYANGTYYADLQEALNAGGTVDVLMDVDISKTLKVNNTVTLNMNGKKIHNTDDIWNEQRGEWSLISVREGGKLTITGNGTLDAKKNDCYAVDVYTEDAICTIENGVFNGNLASVYAYYGKVIIKGGKFDIYQLQNDGGDDYRFMLNCYDSSNKDGKASFEVSGGEFHEYNPASSASENPKANFVVDGKTTRKDGEWYKVVDATENE